MSQDREELVSISPQLFCIHMHACALLDSLCKFVAKVDEVFPNGGQSFPQQWDGIANL